MVIRREGTIALFALAVAVTACNPLQLLPTPPYEADFAAKRFVNWETPHVSPLALGPDGSTLVAVNTADARIELFDVSGDAPVSLGSIPVGLDPVAVRFRDANEVWVANHVSDSVSIVDLQARNVVRTLNTGDEPTDIAFAAGRALVTCSQLNQIWVYDLADLDRAPAILEIQGEDPRALAVSPDGGTVYAAIFESGNHTTLVRWEDVSDPRGPYGGVNPPPNAGVAFSPPMASGLALPPPVSLIVKKDVASGGWLDELGSDWREYIAWDQHDHDLAAIDAGTLEVRYVSGLMNADMHLTTLADGRVAVVGTEATNTTRFEPNLTGKFVHSVMAIVTPSNSAAGIVDLNPQLADAYARGLSRVEPELRAHSLADPRGVVFESSGQRGYVAGMGSNNVIAIDAAGGRLGVVSVGAGPTGLALDEGRGRLYVLSKFDATVSIIDTQSMTETSRVAMYDPTPAEIKNGRPFLYDAHLTSGLGVTACGACHIDARTDQIAWDLGDPSGAVKKFNQECNRPFLDLPAGECEDWHPMKGPMTTQTLQNIIGTEPFHWRGDRESIEAFNPAFVGLLGGQRELTADEMAAFKGFLEQMSYPPNPNRNLDNTLKPLVGDGDPRAGEQVFFKQGIDLSLAKCNDCHETPERGAGTNHRITPRKLLINPHQSIDVPQIRNIYEKTGFSRERQDNNVGFGHNHDGTVDGMFNFFHIPNFTGFAPGEKGDKQRRDVIAYVMSFSTDTHPAVGAQVTLTPANRDEAQVRDRLALLVRLADSRAVRLVAKGALAGVQRGYEYAGAGEFATDRGGEPGVELDALIATVAAGSELTFTVVPAGTQRRLGIDRNDDGILDGD